MPHPSRDSQQFDKLWAAYWLDVQSVGPLTSTRFRLMAREAARACPSPRAILDVGCGPGRFLSFLSLRHAGARLLGIEPSQEAVNAAPPALRPCLVHGDIESNLAVARAFAADLVVCSEVLEHVPDPDVTLAALVEAAAPGATLVLTVPAGRAHWSVQDEEAGHLRRFELEEFEALLRRHGLSVIRAYTWGGPVSWAYTRLVNRVGPSQAAQAAHSPAGRLAARLATWMLRIDDLFTGRTRFQLVAVARKPEAAASGPPR